MKRLLPLYLIMLVSLEGKAQTFTGRVTDRSGKPLVSASVVAKGDDSSVVAIVLKEVKVTPQRIREQGDTLTYSVESFKMKQDRSIADVIAKMPGLEVLPSGTIRYQGKAINKFYIEGMDLLGGKYAMASENLSADKVKSVQVYENHQPVKALKDIKFSEQAALNLILKDEAKNVWQGVVDVATGYGDEWLRDARWLEMVFYIAATNWLFKTKQDDDLKLQVTGLYDCSRQQQDRQTVYLDADSAVITEEQTARSTRSAWQAELLYKANRDNHYLSNTLKGYLDFNQSEGLSMLNGRSSESHPSLLEDGRVVTDEGKANGVPTPQRVEPRKRYIVDNLELINKLKNGQSYSVTSLFSYSYLPGTLLLANDSVQRLTQQMLYWKVYAYYQHSIKQAKVTWQAGFETKNQWLTLGERDRYSEYQPYYTDYISCQQGSGQFENTTGQTANIGLGYRNVMTGLFCSITSGYSHQRDAVICQSRIVNHVYIRQATDFRQNRETYSLSGSLGKSVFWAKLSMTLNGSCQSMTNALQSWNHEIRIGSCVN